MSNEKKKKSIFGLTTPGPDKEQKPQPKKKPPSQGKVQKPQPKKAPVSSQKKEESQDNGKKTLPRSKQRKPQPRKSAPEREPNHTAQPAETKPPSKEPEAVLPPIELPDLSKAQQDACSRAGWPTLTPVQSRAIPFMLAGRDLMVQSRTGSGKTGAFILPLLERISPEKPHCQALVLTPTRELALQITSDAKTLFGEQGPRVVPVYGGVGYGSQLEAIRKGAHLVVGTPGRVLDHLIKRSLSLENLQVLVFDEADRMLSMGFYPDMQRVRSFLPSTPMNVYMFSATYPPHVLRLAGEFLRNPEMLSLSQDRVHVAETEHVFYVSPPMEKDRALVRIIEMENPTSAIIFCNTKSDVHYVSVVLQRFGYDADELSADLSQSKRSQVLTRIRKGQLRFLVATDVAARGIDIPELSHVFQYEPPEDLEAYIHRAGRTGRAGATGKAISLVSGMDKLELKRIAHRFGIKIKEQPLPSDEDVSKLVAERIVSLLESDFRERDRIGIERLRRFLPLAQELGRMEEPLLLAMLLDDFYQKSLQVPPQGPPPKETPPGGEASQKPKRKRRPRRKKQAKKEETGSE